MNEVLRTALVKRFAAPEWACFFEVRNATGFTKSVTRYADAIAMNLYPSRGLEVHGVEVKATRSDWLRELGAPDKSAPIQQYCDRWWVAAVNASIVELGELPPTWGLLILRGDRLVQKVPAPKLEAEPLDRAFIASFLRRAAETTVPRSEVTRMVEERLAVHAKSAELGKELELNMARDQLAYLRERVEKFERASGVKLDDWHDADRIGEAVQFVLRNRGAVEGALKSARETLERAMNSLDRAAEEAKRLNTEVAA